MRIFPLSEEQKQRIMELKQSAEREMAIAKEHAAIAVASCDAIRKILDAVIDDDDYQRQLFRGPEAYIDDFRLHGVTEDFAYVIAEKRPRAIQRV